MDQRVIQLIDAYIKLVKRDQYRARYRNRLLQFERVLNTHNMSLLHTQRTVIERVLSYKGPPLVGLCRYRVMHNKFYALDKKISDFAASVYAQPTVTKLRLLLIVQLLLHTQLRITQILKIPDYGFTNDELGVHVFGVCVHPDISVTFRLLKQLTPHKFVTVTRAAVSKYLLQFTDGQLNTHDVFVYSRYLVEVKNAKNLRTDLQISNQ